MTALAPASTTRPSTPLSDQVSKLEGQVNRAFAGTIGETWDPSRTQEWLSNNAKTASDLLPQLIGDEADAHIIVQSIEKQGAKVIVHGHLIPTDRQVTLTNADRFKLKSLQQKPTPPTRPGATCRLIAAIFSASTMFWRKICR